MVLSLVVFDIFEIRIMGHSRSSKLIPLKRLVTVSY